MINVSIILRLYAIILNLANTVLQNNYPYSSDGSQEHPYPALNRTQDMANRYRLLHFVLLCFANEGATERAAIPEEKRGYSLFPRTNLHCGA